MDCSLIVIMSFCFLPQSLTAMDLTDCPIDDIDRFDIDLDFVLNCASGTVSLSLVKKLW